MMKIFLLSFFLLSCANLKGQSVVKDEVILQKNRTLAPGHVALIEFKLPTDAEQIILKCREQSVKFSIMGENAFAFIPESYFSEDPSFECRLQTEKGEIPVVKFSLEKFKYPEERLKVNPRKIKPRPEDEARIMKEQKTLNALYADSSPTPYFSKAFIPPLDSFITSHYGIKRIYNREHKGQHLGTDFRAQVGVPIPVANKGVVKLAEDLFFTGNTVIVDHGMDIFTVYAHMSELKVKQGDNVELGQIVGLSGSTGRVSGPHLHWGIKILGNWVDGYSLIQESKRLFPTP